jgi:two-component SAPR family response regulator
MLKMNNIDSVMLIDDNDTDIFIHQKILKEAGIKQIHSFNGPVKALEYLMENKIDKTLILLDLYMPVLNGYEFLEKCFSLKLFTETTQVVILSVSQWEKDLAIAAEKKLRFIEKPLTKEKLLENWSL